MDNQAIDRRNFFAAGAMAAGAPMLLAGASIAGAQEVAAEGGDYRPTMDLADSWMDKPGSRHRMAFDLQVHGLEQPGREFGVRGAVAGRVVGGALHQPCEGLDLMVEMGVDELAQRVARG